MRFVAAVAACVLACGAGQALAANARNPYGNVDPRYDAGNDTGNGVTEQLNRQQLQGGGYRPPPPPPPGYGYYRPPPPPPGYYPPPGYPPPPGYYPPPPPPYGYYGR